MKLTRPRRNAIPHLITYLTTDMDYSVLDVSTGEGRTGKPFRNAGHPMYRRLSKPQRAELRELMVYLLAHCPKDATDDDAKQGEEESEGDPNTGREEEDPSVSEAG